MLLFISNFNYSLAMSFGFFFRSNLIFWSVIAFTIYTAYFRLSNSLTIYYETSPFPESIKWVIFVNFISSQIQNGTNLLCRSVEIFVLYIKTMLLFLLELSTRAIEIDCCWSLLWLVPGLPLVSCPYILVSSFTNTACSGNAYSPTLYDFSSFISHVLHVFQSFLVRSKISKYLALLLPVRINSNDRCLLIILIFSVIMNSNCWWLLIIRPEPH